MGFFKIYFRFFGRTNLGVFFLLVENGLFCVEN